MLKSIVNRKRSAFASTLAVATAIGMSASAQATVAPAPEEAKTAPHAVPAPRAATEPRQQTRKQRRAMRRELRQTKRAHNTKIARDTYLLSNGQVVITYGDHWVDYGCSAWSFNHDYRVYVSVCSSALLRGNSGYALRRVADVYYWNGHQSVHWYSQG